MELTGDQNIQEYSKRCGHCKRNTLLPYEYEYTCFSCGYNYDCHMFFKKLVDKKNDKVEFEIIPKTNEEYISVIYGCIRFIDSY